MASGYISKIKDSDLLGKIRMVINIVINMRHLSILEKMGKLKHKKNLYFLRHYTIYYNYTFAMAMMLLKDGSY